MEKTKTYRGFTAYGFHDSVSQKCSIQKSSAVEPKILLGVENTGPHISDNNGVYNSEVNNRMHLTRRQVDDLLPILIMFSETGEI